MPGHGKADPETTVSRPYEVGWNDISMGYYCVLYQNRERTLMDLDEDQVPRLFKRVGAPERRPTSLGILSQYEHPAMAGEPLPPISLEKMWLALHHLLTGDFRVVPSPLSRAILGGTGVPRGCRGRTGTIHLGGGGPRDLDRPRIGDTRGTRLPLRSGGLEGGVAIDAGR